MSTPPRFSSFQGSLVLFILIVALAGFRSWAQQPSSDTEEEQTRMLWNTTFSDKRPAAKKSNAPAGVASAPKGQKPVAVQQAQPAAKTDKIGDSLVGVTIWSLRASEASDDPAVRIGSRTGGEQWTPIRVGADTPLSVGQKVRVSLETARTGYLYVIDR